MKWLQACDYFCDVNRAGDYLKSICKIISQHTSLKVFKDSPSMSVLLPKIDFWSAINHHSVFCKMLRSLLSDYRNVYLSIHDKQYVSWLLLVQSWFCVQKFWLVTIKVWSWHKDISSFCWKHKFFPFSPPSILLLFRFRTSSSWSWLG